MPALNAQSARYQLVDFTIDVLAPLGTGVIQNYLNEHGQGVYEATLHVDNLAKATQLLVEQGMNFEQQVDGTVRFAPDNVGGARWLLISGRS